MDLNKKEEWEKLPQESVDELPALLKNAGIEIEEIKTSPLILKSPLQDAQEMFGEMRGFTQEESDEYEAALDRLSEPTGISFYDEHVGINFLDNMRDFTPEEQKRYNESIRKICKPTGRNLFDVLEENKESEE